MASMNQDTLDDVGPLGGGKSMTVLEEMNDLEEQHDQYIKDIGPQ
jgi:hypothetical protein